MKAASLAYFLLLACSTAPPVLEPDPPPAQAAQDAQAADGQSILVCGEAIPIGTRVVLWTEPPFYDAYKPHPIFSDEGPVGLRFQPGRGATIEELRETVDQFVIHYDACGTSERCFRVLHDERKLSVQFMLDVDGTIYQTLDAKEQAWHATKANPRCVGVEIANLGAEPVASPGVVMENYSVLDTEVPRPWSSGVVQGQELFQIDYTEAQLKALVKLAAGLCRALPRIAPDAPRDAAGRVRDSVLTDAEFGAFAGILGHFHVQANKLDPGPSFPWEEFLADVRRELELR